ncbi:MAG: N-acetyltransferase, partial [Desulfovibrio sp.]|nr:N-acetyltransferase [Desulfovibrio sp.]
DVKSLLNIYSYYVKNTAITFEYTVPTEVDFSHRIEETCITHPWIVAELNGNLVGYAYAHQVKDRAAYAWTVENSVYVHNEHKRAGIGSLLYRELESLLVKQHVRNCTACIACSRRLDPKLPSTSLSFHERMGYKPIGIMHNCGYKFATWYDVCWMEKEINPSDPVLPFIPFPSLP